MDRGDRLTILVFVIMSSACAEHKLYGFAVFFGLTAILVGLDFVIKRLK